MLKIKEIRESIINSLRNEKYDELGNQKKLALDKFKKIMGDDFSINVIGWSTLIIANKKINTRIDLDLSTNTEHTFHINVYDKNDMDLISLKKDIVETIDKCNDAFKAYKKEVDLYYNFDMKKYIEEQKELIDKKTKDKCETLIKELEELKDYFKGKQNDKSQW